MKTGRHFTVKKGFQPYLTNLTTSMTGRQFKRNLCSHFQYRNAHGAQTDIQADTLLLFTPEVNKIEQSWTWEDERFFDSGRIERDDLATIASHNWSPISEGSCATSNVLKECINEPGKESYSANTSLSSSIIVSSDDLTRIDSSADNNEWSQSYSSHTEPSIQENFADTACFVPHSNVEVETELDSQVEFVGPQNLTNYRESTNQDIHTVTVIQKLYQAFPNFESEQQFQDNPPDFLLQKLFALRDKLYTCSDDEELLRDFSELDVLISEYKTNTPNIGHTETRLAVNVLIANITGLCAKAIDFNKRLFNMHHKFSQELTNLPTMYAMPLESSFTENEIEKMHSATNNTVRSNTQPPLVSSGKTSRQETDPRAAFLFIKFLFDNDFDKPTKSQIRSLAKWTNMTEREVDRWFIRTRANYVKSNKDPHKELLSRAVRLRRQFRGPLSELMKPNTYVIKKSFASRKLRRTSQKVI
ncbi:1849_t:CDS:1 [Paraglomus occultum]|uniref:1849_t:CDS:1 n=1 Tax=Paraglomus occultum TaxID=144539 RepID=A0A9N9GKS2_9GLOM|nr:1849_t:CDS:1 [Paraglomus occultum]